MIFMEIVDFGVAEYDEVLKLQLSLFESLILQKKLKKIEKEYLLLGEHLPVITLGRKAIEDNVLVPPPILAQNNIKLYHVGRGGDVTYHCPGQLIVYPIIDLDRYKLGVKQYVDLLEESVILLLKIYGIKGERIEGATGVWIDKGLPNERKICAIGIKCSRFCVMHGISLNVNADLKGFDLINPCGFKDKGVTSILIESKKEIDMHEVKKSFIEIFTRLLQPHTHVQENS